MKNWYVRYIDEEGEFYDFAFETRKEAEAYAKAHPTVYLTLCGACLDDGEVVECEFYKIVYY